MIPACCVAFEVLSSLLLHATPVRNLLRHFHAAQRLVCTVAKLSSRLTAQLFDDKCCRCCHSPAANDFCRVVSQSYGAFSLQAPLCWFVSCFFFSTLAHTSLLVSGGAIPASHYSSSTCWPQTFDDRSTCVVQFRNQFGSMWRSNRN